MMLNINIRLMPSGDEIDVAIDNEVRGRDIIEGLLDEGVAPRVSTGGTPYIYELTSKIKNLTIGEQQTLKQLSIPEGDTLFLSPKIVAG